jgi:hypothetical protein
MGWLAGGARTLLVLHLALRCAFLGVLALLLRERLADAPPGADTAHELQRWLHAMDRAGWAFAAAGVTVLVLLVHRAATLLETRGRPGLRPPRSLALSVAVPPLQLHAGLATLEDLWARSEPTGATASATDAGAAPAAARSAGRFWQHWVMGSFAAWLGTYTLGVMMIPEPVALGLLLIGVAMQLWADLWGLKAVGELKGRLGALDAG